MGLFFVFFEDFLEEGLGFFDVAWDFCAVEVEGSERGLGFGVAFGCRFFCVLEEEGELFGVFFCAFCVDFGDAVLGESVFGGEGACGCELLVVFCGCWDLRFSALIGAGDQEKGQEACPFHTIKGLALYSVLWLSWGGF